jgi:hypothetical protein
MRARWMMLGPYYFYTVDNAICAEVLLSYNSREGHLGVDAR